jgi:hypothetical protein
MWRIERGAEATSRQKTPMPAYLSAWATFLVLLLLLCPTNAAEAERIDASDVGLNARMAVVAFKYDLDLTTRLTEARSKRRGPGSRPLKAAIVERGTLRIVTFGQVTAIVRVIERGIVFTISNNSDSDVRLLWDEASFVDPFSQSHRIIHSSTRPVNATATQVPTVVAAHSNVSDEAIPADYVEWRDSSWIKRRMLSNGASRPVGATVRVTMPIADDDGTVDYAFTYTVQMFPTDIADHQSEIMATTTARQTVKSLPAVGDSESDVLAKLGEPTAKEETHIGNTVFNDWIYARNGVTVRFSAFDRTVAATLSDH